MKIINNTSGKIEIDLGDEFLNAVVIAEGEILSDSFVIYTNSLRQIKPTSKNLTDEEKEKIKNAILIWNSDINTLKFM